MSANTQFNTTLVPSTPARVIAGTIDHGFGLLVEAAASALVIAEVGVLAAGVFFRYVMHSPLIWSDELAQMLFIWLAMLGSVVALRRSEHMRMTTLVMKTSPEIRALLETLALASAVLFLGLVLWPAYEYAEEEHIMMMPAMDIAGSWRAAALPVGMLLMLVAAFLRMATQVRFTTMIIAVGIITVIVAAFVFMQPVFMTLGNANLVIFFVVLIGACVFAGIPIAFAFGLATYGYLALTTTTPIIVMVGRMGEGLSHLILLAVPLFVFLGLLIEITGMARRLIGFLASLLGHVRGGLSYVLIGAMYLVSGISGSKVADMAAIAPALFPEMRNRGAKPGELGALLCATGAQTETIPPSLVLITVGSVTGVSITALFTGGLMPAVVVGFFICCVVWYRYRNEDLSGVVKSTKHEVWTKLLAAAPALALPFVIRFAVVEGIATATEVSTIGIIYAFLVGILVYREFDWSRLRPILVETASLSGAILLIIGAATGMAWALTQSGFSNALADYAANLPGGHFTFFAASIIGFIILGSVLEGIPAIVLFGPLLFPVAHKVGVNEVHYAMVVILSMGIGLFAPPFGVGYYAGCAVGKVAPSEAIKPLYGYLVALVIGVIVIAAVPWFSTGFLK